MRCVRLAALATAVLALAPAPTRAQASASALTYVRADEDRSVGSGPFEKPIPSCSSYAGSLNTPIAAQSTCAVGTDPLDGLPSTTAPTTALVTTIAAFDPAAGTMKSGASIAASGFTLTPFPREYDAGTRIYTGATTAEALGAWSSVYLNDQLLLSHAPGTMPATLTLFLGWTGSLAVPTLPPELGAFVGSAVSLCMGPAGACFDADPTNDVYVGAGSGMDTVLPSQLVNTVATAPGSTAPPTATFAGSAIGSTPATGPRIDVSGLVTFANIPIAASTGFDFAFSMYSYAELYHQSQLAEDCDPAVVQPVPCPVFAPADASGDVLADFSHTVTFAGYQVLDAAGNDVTSAVSLGFRSGLAVPAAPSTAVPEPATIVLVGGGLGLLALGARRTGRRREARDRGREPA